MVRKPSCYDKAVELLARRAHFRAQLERKLEARGYDEAEVETTLDRLREHGYLDDGATARSFVRERRDRKGLGSRRIRSDLLRHGVASEVVDSALAELGEGDETERGLAVARRWLSRGDRRREALARHLERRGYPAHVIGRVLGRLRDEDGQPT